MRATVFIVMFTSNPEHPHSMQQNNLLSALVLINGICFGQRIGKNTTI